MKFKFQAFNLLSSSVASGERGMSEVPISQASFKLLALLPVVVRHCRSPIMPKTRLDCPISLGRSNHIV
jgi:hypothetical protein